MKTFSELREAKATYCGRCGTTHVPPSQGGKCPALEKNEAVQSADKKPETYKDPASGKMKTRMVPVDKEVVKEKTLTPAEKKKREEIAKAMERENPGMDKSKKMAIATATAKRVAEDADLAEGAERQISKAEYIAKGGASNSSQWTTGDQMNKKYWTRRQVKEEAKPDAVEVMRKKQQISNISTSDKDKLLKVRTMLDKEKKK